jgi:2-haloacid dehalogenase
MGAWQVEWVLFNMNGTLLDPAGMAEPLGGGAEERRLVSEAFREALLLTMADTLSGGAWRPLPDYLRAALERTLRARGRELTALDAAIARASSMDAFGEALGALEALQEAGMHTGVLTNSSTDAAEHALASAGLRDRLEVVIGSDGVGSYKPHPSVYEHAADRLGVQRERLCLVAAHAWDVMGAMRAGLCGAWVAHNERWLVPVVPEPDVRGADLEDVASKLIARTAA